MENIIVGYARVPLNEPQRELDERAKLIEEGVDERSIYIDKEKGSDYCRGEYKAMINRLMPGDLVAVTSIDRLGRDCKEYAKHWKEIVEERGADLIVLDMPIFDSRMGDYDLKGKTISDVAIEILEYLGKVERHELSERMKKGNAEARKVKGAYGGRKAIQIDKERFTEIYSEVERKERPNSWAMKQLGLKNNTYYKIVKEYKTKTGRFAEDGVQET